jgi:hypothetical protein
MMYVERQQQRIKHQRKWQIEDRDVAPCRVPNIPLHARIVLISVSLPWDGTTNNAAASAQEKNSRKKSNVCGLQCSNENQINKSWRYIRKSSVLNTIFYVF